MTTLRCLECDAELYVSDMAEAGDLVTCQECDAAFEIVAVDPLEIDFADESEINGDTLLIADDAEVGAAGIAAVLGDEDSWTAGAIDPSVIAAVEGDLEEVDVEEDDDNDDDDDDDDEWDDEWENEGDDDWDETDSDDDWDDDDWDDDDWDDDDWDDDDWDDDDS